MYNLGIYNSPWLSFVKSTLLSAGFGYVRRDQKIPRTLEYFKKVFKTRLKDQYLQTWTDDVAPNAKCINYRMYKSDISLEFYITFLPMKLKTVFSRFRCRNHKLPVETGIYKNIPISGRVCVKCTQSEIGDEFHYIFNCPFFADQSGTYLPKYCHIHPSAPKFKSIMNDKTKLRSLANFIKIILESVK